MATPTELQQKFWEKLKSDMTMMLSVTNAEEGHSRPMAAQLIGEQGPIWFFTSRDNTLMEALTTQDKAVATFCSKNHDVFASIQGRLVEEMDRTKLDQLWNRYVAAWYEGGKDDPKLVLLRFEPGEAEIWKDSSSFVAGLRTLLGADPKEEAKENIAKVHLETQNS